MSDADRSSASGTSAPGASTPSGGDALWPFTFTDAPVRGAIVRLDGVWSQISRDHEPSIAQLLGELLAATALLAQQLKDTDVAMQTRGSGLVHTVMTECLNRDGMRGIARLRPSDPEQEQQRQQPSDAQAQRQGHARTAALFIANEVADIERLLGRGDLAITLRPPVGEAHQGIVPLQGASVAGCIEFYFATSEQLPTHIWLSAANGVAAGMLLQRVPGSPEGNEMSDARAEALWEEIAMLASTLTSQELRHNPVDALLLNLFNAHAVRLLPHTTLTARCTCSRSRSLGVLQLLGREEVASVLAERGSIDMQCQFCGTDYLFYGPELMLLWND